MALVVIMGVLNTGGYGRRAPVARSLARRLVAVGWGDGGGLAVGWEGNRRATGQRWGEREADQPSGHAVRGA